MLKGKVVTLRPIRATDVDALYAYHVDIDNRGDFFPRGILSQPEFQKQFRETGFWSKDEGMLAIVKPEDELVGHIEFFKTVNYLDEYELSYQIYSPENRGRGAATEAVQMLVRYLFENKRVNRIRLVIHPGNMASRRLAARCGFRHEGTARGAWYNRGRHHDVEVYAILHDDVITNRCLMVGLVARGQSSRHAANERMQLTWLIGAPSHVGLGSPTCLRAGRPRLIRHAADASR